MLFKPQTLIACIFFTGTATNVSAEYDSNIGGRISSVLTYQDGSLLFKLENQPTTHPSCQTDYFAIDSAGDSGAINRMYARVLLAYQSGNSITIGYDGQGDCVNNRMRVYRVG